MVEAQWLRLNLKLLEADFFRNGRCLLILNAYHNDGFICEVPAGIFYKDREPAIEAVMKTEYLHNDGERRARKLTVRSYCYVSFMVMWQHTPEPTLIKCWIYAQSIKKTKKLLCHFFNVLKTG